MKPAWILAASALVCAAACGRHPRPFDLRPVVGPAITELEARDQESPAAAPADVDERATSLLRRAEVGVDEGLLAGARAIGSAGVPLFLSTANDAALALPRRAGALLLLGATRSTRAGDALLGILARDPDPRIRGASARALAIAELDQAIPALLVRLAREPDPAVAAEIAETLAALGNYAGLARADRPAEPGHSSPTAGAAEAWLARARARRPSAQWENLQGSARDVLQRLWSSGDPQGLLSLGEPSPRHRLEVWRRIAALNSYAAEESLLVLANESSWVAELLANALHDADADVRTGAARALARMGARASDAGPALVSALDEPSLATEAALALGAIGHAPAVGALRAALRADEASELGAAAACALARLGRGDEVASQLCVALSSSRGQRANAEAALEAWLVEKDRRGEATAHDVLIRWKKLSGPPGLESDARTLDARRRARAELVHAALDRLQAQ